MLSEADQDRDIAITSPGAPLSSSYEELSGEREHFVLSILPAYMFVELD